MTIRYDNMSWVKEIESQNVLVRFSSFGEVVSHFIKRAHCAITPEKDRIEATSTALPPPI